jgi:hypothetical protein
MSFPQAHVFELLWNSSVGPHDDGQLIYLRASVQVCSELVTTTQTRYSHY